MSKIDVRLSAQLDADALERYERALQDAADVREAWVRDGRLLTVVLGNGCEAVAPLWRALQDAERHAARMARELRLPGRPGRKSLLEGQLPQATGLPMPPAAKLRRITPK